MSISSIQEIVGVPRIRKVLGKSLRVFPAVFACLFLWSCEGRSTAEEASMDGILIMGNSGEPKGLDPHIVSGVLESNVIRSLFEGLVEAHPSKDGVALPGVATKWYAVNPKQPDEWVFELRKDAQWSDGKPLTAQDFIFSFRRLLTPALASDYSFMLYYVKDAEFYHKSQRSYLLSRNDANFTKEWWASLKEVDFGPDEQAKEGSFNFIGLDKLNVSQLQRLLKEPDLFKWPDNVSPEIRRDLMMKNLNYEKSNRGKIGKEELKDLWELIDFGASAPDEHTLRVKLNSPIPFLPEITKHYTWYPVPKHAVLKHGKIGDRFTDWTKPDNLVCNGAFILKSWKFNDHIEVTRNPLYWDKENVGINGVRFLPITNLYTEDRMYYDEQMHVTYTIASELIEYSRKNYPEHVRSELYLGTYFIRTNVANKPFTDPRVRLAFSLSLNQKSLIDNVLKGGQKPAAGLVPPFGDYPASDVVTFNPELARKLLAEAGYPGGKGLPDIEFLTTDKESSKMTAEALQAMWKEHLGATIKIKQMEWTSYITAMFDKDYDLAAGGWIGDYMDPLTFLDMWMKDAGNNRTGWHNEEFEKILGEAAQTGDPTERYALLAKAEALFLDERPILPVYWYTRNYLLHPDVKGWNPLLLDNHPYKFLRLEPGSGGKKD
ncbi:MAG: peptide ABC transporter substrate-binding protein [Opitutae bacterium]|nr:peptide ABC transporter substrate-binding protein [Opitutae bacterium]